ncbi:MAG TPA: hypothetical protein VF310_01970, partial [Vicinamibacteria bacterium]
MRYRSAKPGLVLLLLGGSLGCGGSGGPGTPSNPGASSSVTDTAAPGSCTFSGPWLAAATVQHLEFDPIVVNPRIPDAVALKLKAPPSVDSAVVELAAGGTVTLTPSGPNLFCGMFTPAQVLAGYQADDVQHNFVGFLNLNSGPTRLTRINVFINVADESVPLVAPERLQDDLQVTPHLANIVVSDRLPQNLDLAAVARRFYQAYPDAYDFLNIVSTPSYTGNRFHFTVRNAVGGIGVDTIDNTAAYGSAGRLQGISRFPIGSFFDMAEKSGIHELGHQWIAFLGGIPALSPGRPHWPPSTLAYGIMGFSIGGMGGQGGEFSYALTPLGAGEYRLDPTSPADAYNDMELYLMGLAPPESVGPHVVLEDKAPCAGCVFKGTTVTVQDVIAAHGPRVPAYPNAPTRFTMASMIVSDRRL